MSSKKTKLSILIQYPATHYYAANKSSKSFLSFPHRHIFHIRCFFAVETLDRELEFFELQDLVIDYLNKKYSSDFKSNSCEMIANELITVFNLKRCEVYEDGENGAIVEILDR